jgi:sensor histidine kinase YesM
VRENRFIPPVVITALKKFNNVVALPLSITEADEIELWYTDNFISFEFAALGFSFSEKNRFRYKLEGFDKYWIDAGTKNEAVYTNLDGGTYTFRVKACNSDGVWNEEGRALRVIVHPPFWRRTWFYAVCGIILAGSVWGTFRWRVRNFTKRTEELKRLVDERTSQLQSSYQELEVEKQRTEEHSTEVQRLNDVLNAHNAELAQQTRTAQLEMLRYQLNPHFLFNALISINDLIQEDPKHAARTMTMLMAYLRYALQPAGLPSTPLSEELKALRSYLAIEQVRFEERLQVHFEIAPEAESVRVPSFLLQPLVENAIKYGMRTSSMPLRIWVVAKRTEEQRLVVEVINSGTLHVPEGVTKPEGTGTGLRNIRERLQVLFPEKHRLELSEQSGRVCVRIELEISS